MDRPSVQELCELASGVRPEDATALARVGTCLPLLADLAGADLALLVRAGEPQRLLVLGEGRPGAARSFYARPRTGEILPEASEPPASRCLRTGRAQRARHASVMGGRPAEQTALPVHDAAGQTIAAVSVERSLLNGPWLPAHRPLRSAAEDAAQFWLQGALAPQDLLNLLRMGRGLTIAGPDGEVLYLDDAARETWRRTGSERDGVGRVAPGPASHAAVLSEVEDEWGRVWEFNVDGAVFRRRDALLGPEADGGVLIALHDITPLHAGQRMISTRSAALQEIHHRVKNNLQTISSLLRMQARREASDPARDSLRTAIGRVQSVALVHEALSLDGTEEVDLKALASTLVDAALHDTQRGTARIASAILGPRLFIPAVRASQVALVLNEAIQNAVKHAFPDERAGSLTIRFEQTPDRLRIVIQDDGIGLPAGFSPDRTPSLGLQIARAIVESDLGGALELTSDGGARMTLHLPAALAHSEVDHP